MAVFTRSVTIDRPADKVFTFIEDPANVPKWLEGVVSIEPLTEGPMRAGWRFKETRMIGKRESSAVIEVREHEGPRQGKQPPYRHRAGATIMGVDAVYDFTFHSLDGVRTRVDVVAEVKATNMLGKLFVGIAAKGMEKQDSEMLDRLKRSLETAMG